MQRNSWIAIICLLSILVIASPQTAAAKDQPGNVLSGFLPTDQVGWAVEMDVVRAQLRVSWIITIWRESLADQYELIATFNLPLYCNTVGAVNVLYDAVSFNGGYLRCPRPGLAQTVYELTDGVIQLPPNGDMLFQTVVADAVVALAAPGASAHAPLAWDSSGLAYEVRFDDGSQGQMWLTLHDSENNLFETFSDPFSLTSVVSHLRSEELDCNGDADQAAFSHALNDNVLNIQDSPCYFRFDMDPAITYIGYDPDKGAIFKGLMLELFIDPPSKGPGIVTSCEHC